MPNWCTNTLTVSDSRVLESVLNSEGAVDFSIVVPPPSNIETGNCSGKHDEGVVCWYEWNLANWGTKWNAGDAYGSGSVVCFDTAWSPPVEWFEQLVYLYPDTPLSLEWEEPGMGFAGTATNENGQLVVSEYEMDLDDYFAE